MQATTPGDSMPMRGDGQHQQQVDLGDERQGSAPQKRRQQKKPSARSKASPPGTFEPPGNFSWPAARAPGLVSQTARTPLVPPPPYAAPVPVPQTVTAQMIGMEFAARAAIATQAAVHAAALQASLLRQHQQQSLVASNNRYMNDHSLPSTSQRSQEQHRKQEQTQQAHRKEEREALFVAPIEDQPVYVGVLKTFSPKDGYGFISCPELREKFDRDVYIHKAEIPESASVSCGCSLRFRLHLNPKGQPQARTVSFVETAASEAPEALAAENLLLDFAWETLPDEAPLRVQAGAQMAGPVRICSWNILAVAYANCKAFPDVEPSVLSWDRRKGQVARALELMNADIVCLQEVDRPLQDLGLQEYEQVRAQRPDGRADGCIIAWKKGSFTLVTSEVISFDNHVPSTSGSDTERFRRGNCAAIAELRRSSSKGPRSTFLVATTHLCWEVECEDVRQQQASVLLEALKARSQRLGHRTVLCGDLNAMPGCRSHRTITEALPSVYRDLEAEDTVTNSNASAGPAIVHGSDVSGDRESGSTGRAPKEREGFAGMLDYLCLDSRGAKVSSRLKLPGRPELRDKLGQGSDGPLPTLLCSSWPSDHLPVAADINFAVVFQ